MKLKFGRSDFERQHYALLADNIAKCRANVLDVFAEYPTIGETDDLYRAATHVLSVNLVHGDALTMRAMGDIGEPFGQTQYR